MMICDDNKSYCGQQLRKRRVSSQLGPTNREIEVLTPELAAPCQIGICHSLEESRLVETLLCHLPAPNSISYQLLLDS